MIPNYTKKTLQNGFEIYHIPMSRGSGVISVDLFYKVGSRNETLGLSGIAHMLEHLNFKSTKTRKAGEFDRIVKAFGGINNASTGFDSTHYFIKCSSQNLSTALDLYADIMQNLTLDESEFATERNVVLEERLWRTDNSPSGLLFFRLYNHAFLRHSYHWTPIGFKGDITGWTIENIREFHAKFYQPQNAFLIISGDVDEKSVFDLGEKYFGEIKNSSKIPNTNLTEPAQDGEKFAIIHKQTPIEYLMCGYKIPPFSHEDRIFLEALALILSGGNSGILNQILIDEKRLVNSIDLFPIFSIDENLAIISAVCNPQVDAQNVAKEIKNIIANLQISDSDIEKVKNQLKSEFVFSFDSAHKTAAIFGEYIIKSNLDDLTKFHEQIQQISKENLLKTLRKYFVSKNLTTLILKRENDEK
jgi:peptidase, M16 family